MGPVCAPAYPISQAAHQTADQNVSSVQSAVSPLLVSARSVLIRAQEFVAPMPDAKLSITIQFVNALKDTLEIHLLDVIWGVSLNQISYFLVKMDSKTKH